MFLYTAFMNKGLFDSLSWEERNNTQKNALMETGTWDLSFYSDLLEEVSPGFRIQDAYF